MSEEQQLGPSDDGTVMLDIGGDIGALILHTNADLLRAEIEISPADGTAEDVFQRDHPHDHPHGDDHAHSHSHDGPPRTHVAVRERRGAAGIRYAAIYPGLRQGDYTLWGVDGQPRDTVHINGGEVTEIDWR